MFSSDREDGRWRKISLNPRFESTLADEISTVACIRESSHRAGKYEDGAIGYRVALEMLLVNWLDGKVQQKGGISADPPLKKVGDGDRFGEPDIQELFDQEARFSYPDTLPPLKPDGVMVAGIKYSPDGQTLIVEDAKGGTTSIDLVSGQTLESSREELVSDYSPPLEVTAVSPDTTIIAQSHDDSNITLSDNKTKELLHTLVRHLGRITSLTFSPDGTVLASGAGDGRVILWNVKTGELIRSFFIAETSVATPNTPLLPLKFIDADGNRFSSDDFKGKVVLYYVWDGLCSWCESDMRTLQAYFATYQDSGFAVVGVVDGSGLFAEEKDMLETAKGQVRTAIQNYSLTFPILLYADYDSEQNLHPDYSPAPQFYVADRNGVVRLRWGADSEEFTESFVTTEFLEKYVTPLIKEQ